ncbi:hypothetical protein Ccrd_000682 [Cynara cardunculus var. scolymus]|uniref:RING-type domain-containing protein n=1 Tax=Cynara cardunculus var. scolymus TaxID=59895 RepID=A0A118JYK0_CYNCS|nr:hypothetical protein Ccrd_000682 [Cynara cardunculus var. scolymus]
MVLILANKSNISIIAVYVIIFCRILKSIHHNHQFPIFTAKRNLTAVTKLLYCAVCLHDVDREQNYRRLPQCHHCFHVSCIDTWLQSRSTCLYVEIRSLFIFFLRSRKSSRGINNHLTSKAVVYVNVIQTFYSIFPTFIIKIINYLQFPIINTLLVEVKSSSASSSSSKHQLAMDAQQIDLLVAKLSGIVVLILTNKSNIFIVVVVVLILRCILKSIYHRHQFPIFTVKRNVTAATKPLYCAVCLHDIDGGQRYRRLPQCHHCFHVNCIDTWLQSQSTCPLCRNQVPLHLLPRKQKKTSYFYLFIYFSMKAIRKRIGTNFNKMML